MAHLLPLRGRVALTTLLVALVLPVAAARADDATEASPWTSPVGIGATVSQGNGGSRSHTDPGAFYAWDYRVSVGTPIVAARDGKVIEVTVHHTLGGTESRYRDMANRIVLEHDDGLRSIYAHLEPEGACVRVGERVFRGERIGTSGNTGFSSGPHLHFCVLDREGVSVPIHFADFELSEGVPWEGDHHQAGPEPDLPQEDIDACRAKVRAAQRALAEGWPEIGLLVIGKHRPRREHADHALHQEIARLQATCAEQLDGLAAHVRETPTSDELVVLHLACTSVALERAKASRALRSDVRDALRALPEDAAKAARGLRSAATRLVKGMAKECLEEEGAAKEYAALLTHRVASVRGLARARFDRLVERALSSWGRDVARLKRSAREAGPEHGRMLLDYAEATLDAHQDHLQQAMKPRSERRDELKAALKQLRAERREFEKLLG